MIGVVAALLAAYGTFLLWSSFALHWEGYGFGPRRPRPTRLSVAQRFARAGLSDVSPTQLAATVAAMAVVGAAIGFILFNGVIPALICAIFAGGFPMANVRARQSNRKAQAREAWPRMLEELRMLTGSLGRSIPQALFEVGRRAPAEMRPAFRRAHREWMLTTDFARTLELLKTGLADATADAVCETLAVANEVGGGGLDRRLSALAEDRLDDVQAHKDARAKQAGVKFARRFVLLVPLGMALAGLSIGNGRAAYRSAGGQVAVAIGLVCIAACWAWSGRLLHLPPERRVFAGPPRPVIVAAPPDIDPTPAEGSRQPAVDAAGERSNW